MINIINDQYNNESNNNKLTFKKENIITFKYLYKLKIIFIFYCSVFLNIYFVLLLLLYICITCIIIT